MTLQSLSETNDVSAEWNGKEKRQVQMTSSAGAYKPH